MIATNVFLIHLTCYWIMVYLYDKNVIYDWTILLDEPVRLSLKNQFFYTYPTINIIFSYYPENYENFLSSLLYIPLLAVYNDIYFFVMHRPLHTKYLYKYHKSHHTGKTRVAKSLDSDMLEHIVGNLGSFFSGIFLLQYFGYIMNVYVLFLWVGIATVNVCVSHIGEDKLSNTNPHYIHHKRRKCNYGSGIYLMDRLVGTYRGE